VSTPQDGVAAPGEAGDAHRTQPAEKATTSMALADRHHGPSAPSKWVHRFAALVPRAGPVLDVACGAGRHVRLFLERGHPVTAVDRDLSGLDDLAGAAGLEMVEADLETGAPPPFAGRRFAAVVVTNYLHRPLLPAMVDAVAEDGVLIYETFAQGNERFGRPRRPEFLAAPGELFAAAVGRLHVLSYENLRVDRPRPAVVQRVAAVGPLNPADPANETGDPR
jgi:SAM-dependent methyltransferase